MNTALLRFKNSLRVWANQLVNSLKHPQPFNRKKLAYPFRALVRPFDTFSDIKYEKMGSLFIANGILFCYFLISVLSYFYTGYLFNDNRIDQFSLLSQLFYSVALLFIWAVSNWSVCTLMNGEGNMRDIWTVSSYALLPVLLGKIVTLPLSNFIVYEEQVYIQLIDVTSFLLFCFLMFCGLLTVHQYTVSKTLFSCLLTIVGVVLIIFLGILFFSIVQQMIGFVNTVFVELLNKT